LISSGLHKRGHVLTSGRQVGAEVAPDNGDPFTGEGGPGAVAQQPLEAGVIPGLDMEINWAAP